MWCVSHSRLNSRRAPLLDSLILKNVRATTLRLLENQVGFFSKSHDTTLELHAMMEWMHFRWGYVANKPCGTPVGEELVGWEDGAVVGATVVGATVGEPVGLVVGISDGELVGELVGDLAPANESFDHSSFCDLLLRNSLKCSMPSPAATQTNPIVNNETPIITLPYPRLNRLLSCATVYSPGMKKLARVL